MGGHYHHVRAGSDRYQMEASDGLLAAGHEVIPFASRHADNEESEWERFFPVGSDTSNPHFRDLPRFVYSVDARRKIAQLIREG